MDDTVLECQIPKGCKRVSPEPMLVKMEMVIDEDQEGEKCTGKEEFLTT